MLKLLIVLCAALLGGAGCETEVPAGVDLGVDLFHAADLSRPADLAMPTDLAAHIVALPPPTKIAVVYRATLPGAVVDVTVTRAPGTTRLRLLRRAADLPTGPFDPMATLVYEGHGEAATHAVRQLVALELNYYAAFSCDDVGGCEDFGVQVPFAVTVMEALADGGYTLYMRHAEDGVCTDAVSLGPALQTSVAGWWTSCAADCATATASQLTADGDARATELGAALRARAFPIARLHVSEMCRATDTASRLGLSPMLERDPDLTPFAYDESRRCTTSRARIAESPPPGSNTLYVGHAGFAAPCDPIGDLGFLWTAIYRPDPSMSGHPRFIGLVLPAEWPQLP